MVYALLVKSPGPSEDNQKKLQSSGIIQSPGKQRLTYKNWPSAVIISFFVSSYETLYLKTTTTITTTILELYEFWAIIFIIF